MVTGYLGISGVKATGDHMPIIGIIYSRRADNKDIFHRPFLRNSFHGHILLITTVRITTTAPSSFFVLYFLLFLVRERECIIVSCNSISNQSFTLHWVRIIYRNKSWSPPMTRATCFQRIMSRSAPCHPGCTKSPIWLWYSHVLCMNRQFNTLVYDRN